MSDKKIIRTDIQVLRGVAVLSVVIFHSQSAIMNGYLGVDVFFVISGYVVTPLIVRIVSSREILQIKSEFLTFFKNRFYRLAPALFCMFLFTIPIIFAFASPSDHSRIAKQGLSTLFLVANFGAYKINGDYFTSALNPFIHSWSLSVEEQFYLVIPLIFVLVFINFKEKSSDLTLTKKILEVIFCLSFLLYIFPNCLTPFYNFLNINSIEIITFYSPHTRVWQFALGGLASLVFHNWLGKFNVLKIKLVASIFLLILLFTNVNMGMYINTLAVCFATAIILGLGSTLSTSKNNILLWFGDRSYSIYLFHMPFLYIALMTPLNVSNSGQIKFLLTIIALAGTLFASSLCYKYIELRFRNKNWISSLSSPLILKHFSIGFFPISAALSLLLIGSSCNYWGGETLNVKSTVAWNIDQNCLRMNQDIDALPCDYNHFSDSPRVLLVGDSHAAMYSEVLLKTATHQNWNVSIWTMGACNFVLTVNKGADITCVNRNRKILDYVRSNRPQLIVLSQYYHSFNKIGEVTKGIEELSKYSKRLLLIGNNPAWPDINQFGQRLPLIIRDYSAIKVLPKTSFYSSDNLFSSQVLNWGTNQKNTITLDPFQTLCNLEVCTRYENDEWLYWDSHHLSLQGANKFGLFFSSLFSKTI